METLMGLDVGQKASPSGLCVVEVDEREMEGPAGSHFLVHFLERIPAGTPYPEIARRAGEVVSSVKERTGEAPQVFVNATGLGQPLVELIKEQCPSVWRLCAVYFNHGDRHRQPEWGLLELGKAHLVVRLQILLQADRLHLPPSVRVRENLTRELLDYQVRIEHDANQRYGSFRVGTQDDLVTALGLAVLEEPLRIFIG